MAEDTTFEVKGLEQLIKALKVRPPVARIGILGSSNARQGKSGQSNAEIGATHEFGTSKIPRRSFLRVPLSDRLDKEIQASGQLDAEALKKVLKDGSVTPWLKKIAEIGVAVVHGAFNSGGYGQWAAWKNPNYTNNTGMILKDTQQLSESISYEVKS